MGFETFTFDDARKIITDLKDECARSVLALHLGDHWQGSTMWIGPRPSSSESGASTVLEEIRRGLVSKNAVKEVSNRHTSAVLGHEPDWSLTPIRPLKADEKPTGEEQSLIDEAEAALTEFWDSRSILNQLNASLIYLYTYGRFPLRLFVPPGLIPETGIVQATNLQEAFNLIYLDATPPKLKKTSYLQANNYDLDASLPDVMTVYRDPQTQGEIGIYSYQDEDGDARMELTFLDDLGRTVVITNLGETAGDEQMALADLGKRLTMFEMRREPLITNQVKQQQALLNMAHTMMARNVVLGGFLERVILNAQMPGKVSKDSDGNEVWTPNPYYVGAGSTNFLKGETIIDSQGNERIATPSVVYREPVSVQTFNDTAESAYKAILEEVHQLHALIAGDATASGESRKQAMDDFRKSLQPTKAQIDSAGRWLLETSLAMAAQFSNQPGRFNTLRAMFDSKIDVGKPTAEEINTGIALVEKKIWKRARLQVMTNVEDPEAEDSAIQADTEVVSPIQNVQLERAKLNLQSDQQGTQDAIRQRIDAASGVKDLGTAA